MRRASRRALLQIGVSLQVERFLRLSRGLAKIPQPTSSMLGLVSRFQGSVSAKMGGRPPPSGRVGMMETLIPECTSLSAKGGTTVGSVGGGLQVARCDVETLLHFFRRKSSDLFFIFFIFYPLNPGGGLSPHLSLLSQPRRDPQSLAEMLAEMPENTSESLSSRGT